MGPLLEAGELNSIFELGYRKAAARAVGAGWGMGMAFLGDLVELHHRGKILFFQEAVSRQINGIAYSRDFWWRYPSPGRRERAVDSNISGTRKRDEPDPQDLLLHRRPHLRLPGAAGRGRRAAARRAPR